jgi:hypothetical protein
MFGDIAIVFILFVILPSIIFGFIKDIKKEKYKAMASTGKAEDGIRASDLRDILREAVEDAVAPLDARIEQLEADLRASGVIAPEARLSAAVLADALDDDLEEEDALDTPAPRLRS